MSGRETYDASPIQKKILLERHARATRLRNEYLSKRLNPFRHALGDGGHFEDPAVDRVMALRTTMIERINPNWRSAVFFVATIGSMVLISYYGSHWVRELKLKPIREGRVSYHERTDKFV